MPVFTNDELDQLAREWTLTYRLGLPARPAIAVAGAYKGKLMCLLAREYPDAKRIIGFEPQSWAYKEALRATDMIEVARVDDHGLLAETENKFLRMEDYSTDAATIMATEPVRESGGAFFIDAAIAIKPYLPLDLFVMNLEGYEWKLLPYLVNHVLSTRIARFAVQFHTRWCPDEADQAMVLMSVDEKYTRVYEEYPQWILWSRR